MGELAKVYKEVKFNWCNSDEAQDIVEKLDISQVPTLALFHPHKVAPELFENPSPEKLSQVIEVQNEFYQKWFEEEKKKAFREIEDMVTSNPQFFMFIKGSPAEPKCKFTRKLLEMLTPKGYRFRTFDILKDERIRQWLKFYSNWPTFPQVFLEGKFVGGVDIVTELVENGEFDEMVPSNAKKPAPLDEFKEILTSHKVVALLQGTVDAPADQQSKDLVTLLKRNGVQFVAIDLVQRKDILQVLTDTGVLKELPVLYTNGSFVGGLTTVQQAEESGDLAKILPAECVVETIEARLKRLVNQKKVMLFMKGSPKLAQCGFSQKIVNLLANYPSVDYGHFDIFKDEQVREGLKKFSNWPTYPQLYVNGNLVGGIDICLELHENGELEEALTEQK